MTASVLPLARPDEDGAAFNAHGIDGQRVAASDALHGRVEDAAVAHVEAPEVGEAGHDAVVQVAERERRADVRTPGAKDMVAAVHVGEDEPLPERLDLAHLAGRHLAYLGDLLPLRHRLSPCFRYRG